MEADNEVTIKKEGGCEVIISEENISKRTEEKETNIGLKLRNLSDISRAKSSDSQDVLADVSSSTGVNISLENWPGDCDFRIDKQTQSSNEKEKASDATYSEMLDKLFCDVNKCFSIRFFVGSQMYPMEQLTIRTMVVYTSPGDMATPVVRCPNHLSAADPINSSITDPEQLEHVLWSAGKEAAKYEKNESSGRYSFTTPFGLPHVGSHHVTHLFKFTCIGSCAGGINRRPTAIVFTLEHNSMVIGRQTLSCRICSCPKRDRKAQETSHMRHSLEQNTLQPPICKKKKSVGSGVSPQNNGMRTPMKLPVPPGEHEVFLVPIFGQENYTVLSKFAEYLDSSSGALQNPAYALKRAQLIFEHNNRKAMKRKHMMEDLEFGDDDDDDGEEEEEEEDSKLFLRNR